MSDAALGVRFTLLTYSLREIPDANCDLIGNAPTVYNFYNP